MLYWVRSPRQTNVARSFLAVDLTSSESSDVCNHRSQDSKKDAWWEINEGALVREITGHHSMKGNGKNSGGSLTGEGWRETSNTKDIWKNWGETFYVYLKCMYIIYICMCVHIHTCILYMCTHTHIFLNEVMLLGVITLPRRAID